MEKARFGGPSPFSGASGARTTIDAKAPDRRFAWASVLSPDTYCRASVSSAPADHSGPRPAQLTDELHRMRDHRKRHRPLQPTAGQAT